jgi:hypothetical protein
VTEIEIYNRVRIVTPRFAEEGVTPGMHGYVLERYPDGNYEIEVSDPATGETIALFAATPADVELDESG